MGTMSPLLRVWGYTAGLVAALLLLRGMWMPAAALFLLSPAPVMMFAPRGLDTRRLSLTWFGGIVLAVVLLAVGVRSGSCTRAASRRCTSGVRPADRCRDAARLFARSIDVAAGRLVNVRVPPGVS